MKVVVVALVASLFVGVAAAVTCSDYCSLLAIACTGDSSSSNQFPFQSEAGCLAVCATYPTDGTDGATTGNTLQCRMYHATVANASTTAAQTHCLHAGSAGATTWCGSTCEAYCNLMVTGDAGASLGDAPFVDKTACNAYCSRYFQTSGGQTLPPITSGNNAECREYHARVAVQSSGATRQAHFKHALPASASDQCVNVGGTDYSNAVENYCDTMMAACGNSTAVGSYASRLDCLKQASILPRGYVKDGYNGNQNNTLDCRIYHSGVARDIPSHCAHSGLQGLDQCGKGPCDSYCLAITTACTGTDAQYDSYTDCMMRCAGVIPQTGTAGDVSGNTLQCRMYHLGVAISSTTSSDKTAHCGHAGPSGGSVCGSKCEAYCDLVMEACTPSATYPFNQQYLNRAQCLLMCAAFPAGTVSDTDGDTLGCRVYHAKVALGYKLAVNPSLNAYHCPHAGASGGFACGATVCEGFCDVMQLYCVDDYAQFGSRSDCVSACNAWPLTGSPVSTQGNTFQCRAYHLAVAVLSDLNATTGRPYHCPHAGNTGAGVCVDPPTCDKFCNTVQSACVGTNVQWATNTSCQAACATWPLGMLTDTAGDSVGCRTYHAGVASGSASAAAEHCPHAGPRGGNGVCGTQCDAYCDLMGNACRGDNKQFETRDACMTACATYPTTGAVGDVSGNTFQCRFYHATVANEGMADPTTTQTHCPHAGATGGTTAQCAAPVAASSSASVMLSSSGRNTVNAASSVAASAATVVVAVAVAAVALSL